MQRHVLTPAGGAVGGGPRRLHEKATRVSWAQAQPHPAHQPDSKLEAAFHRADKAIQNIVDLLNAA